MFVVVGNELAGKIGVKISPEVPRFAQHLYEVWGPTIQRMEAEMDHGFQCRNLLHIQQPPHRS